MATVHASSVDFDKSLEPSRAVEELRGWRMLSSQSLDSTLADSTEFDIRQYNQGVIIFGSAGTLASVTFYLSNTSGGTYRQLMDGAGNAVSKTIAQNEALEIPSEAMAGHYLKIVPNADVTAHICLKG